MRLRLNLDDVDVQLKVTGWRPLPDSDDDYYDDWCDVELSLQSKYLNYCPSGELIMHSELEWLRDALKRLLDGTLDKDTHISFAEPDLEFMLHPAKRCYSQPGVVIYRDGYRDFDIDMDFMIRF